MIIINDFLGVYGGSITLIERLCIYLKQLNEEVIVYTNSVANTEIVDKLKKLNVTIRCFDTCNIALLKAKIVLDSKNSQLLMLNFVLTNYLNVELVKSKININVSNILYCIHPKTFYRGTGVPIHALRELVKKFYSKLTKKIINKGQVIFMDHECISATEKFYKCDLGKKLLIQALPMICNELDNYTVNAKIHNSYQNKNIITACRADFPFKGYVFGLIDNYVELCEKYKNVTLTIVCSGPKCNVDKVKDKILHLDKEIQKSIKFYDWMNYQALKDLLSKSYLFVGMGTGVLDSALLYIPSIAVKYDSYECISDCAFYENPSCLTSRVDCNINAIEVMDRILSLEENQYKAISKLSFEKAKEFYDIKSFVNQVINMNNTQVNLTIVERLIYSFNLFINKFRKNSKYSCEEIEREE